MSSQPEKPQTWAIMAAQSLKKNETKLSLTHFPREVREDSRLIVRLEENSPHKKEHSFFLQKKANAVLPKIVVVGRVAYIDTGIALIPATCTSI